MMTILMMLIFMIPLCLMNFFIPVQVVYLFSYLYVLLSGSFSYFSKISYLFGLDFFSFNLIMLSFLISSFMIISMLGSFMMEFYMIINLLLSFFLFFIFCVMDFMYMYICFEFVLVPLVILIMIWGYQPERLIAGMYLFFYTLLVSLPLLVLLIYIYMNVGSMFFDYMIMNSSFFVSHFILTIVFMVKFPMYLVHYWLPKAHVQAPVSGSMILAGLMLKIGGYGIIRSMYMYEYMYMYYSYIWYSICLLGSLLISLICLIQADIKCMIAYSSISHMGMVIMGLLTMSTWGLMGSFMMMLGHGFCSSGLFYISNLFYFRTGSRSFYINKGLLIYLPTSSLFMFLLCSFNMSCPPSINFISEFMILTSMMNYWLNSIFFFILMSFFCACFSYYLYSFSQHGSFHNLYSFSSFNVIEFICLFMHLLPLVLFPLMIMSLF
uniref:NADH-ubiquinone oxidoreductase chain 4 n=1 Tax=Maiestas dorsalis TaxID=1928073 RepID=A0A343ASR7_9HEMI|nr:NADH dehydrogenase subunit 4 [Maiestas dorsalis]APO09328.1 NADH dehydrogenase subunit 4 [Maiestas dorsalis]